MKRSSEPKTSGIFEVAVMAVALAGLFLVVVVAIGFALFRAAEDRQPVENGSSDMQRPVIEQLLPAPPAEVIG